jgi:hypothetical protein
MASIEQSTEPLIWWTSEADCLAITRRREGCLNVPGAPAYLRKQYSSRYGRNGRGRLWVAKQFGEVAVDPWPNTPFARRLGNACAGIVIAPEDLRFIAKLPGVVTDLRLNRRG